MNTTTYTEFREKLLSMYINKYEIPTSYWTSIPLPTLRLETPSYAMFACPSTLLPRKPVKLDSPERWWVFDAITCQILLFAHVKVMPFSKQKFTSFELEPSGRDIDEQETLLIRLENLLNIASNQFFEGKAVDTANRDALVQVLTLVLPKAVLPTYYELTPDFFTWLKS